MSKWWPISFFIAAVIFFIIGGGLIGAWASSATAYDSYDSYDSYDYTYYYSNSGEYYGALACFALGGICKFVAWVLLIVWCVKRSRSRTVVVTQAYEPYQSYGNNYAAPAAPQGYAPVPVPSPAPVPPYGNAQTAPNQTGGQMRYCTNCGTAVTTPFCSQCGIKG